MIGKIVDSYRTECGNSGYLVEGPDGGITAVNCSVGPHGPCSEDNGVDCDEDRCPYIAAESLFLGTEEDIADLLDEYYHGKEADHDQ